jgi:hypothetical protein
MEDGSDLRCKAKTPFGTVLWLQFMTNVLQYSWTEGLSGRLWTSGNRLRISISDRTLSGDLSA